MSIAVDTFFLDPDAPGTLQTKIQQMIAEGILSGRLHRGEKLPSSRKLARHLGVSRITVMLVYTELVANDYLVSKGRSGYFVSETAPVPPVYSPARRQQDAVDWDRAIPQRFTGGDTPQKPANWQDYRYPFIYGQTDPTLFDHASWRLCAVQALGQKDFISLTTDYYDQDDPLLTDFIARRTLPRRGISAHPDEILITMGAQNALWLTARLLLGPDKSAVIEDPCYHALRDILCHTGATVGTVPVDADGLPPDAVPPGADVLFVTPSHQVPTTATMSRARRRDLLDLAARTDALIVEDDYEFEMSFLASPLPALKSMDRDGRVIYVGSFSKSLFPGLRLGYLVGSRSFIREARALRANVLRHPPGHIQRTAAYFLSLGHYDIQIKRMSSILRARRTAMESAISRSGLTVAGRGVFGGSSFWMRAPAGQNLHLLAAKLAQKSVLIEPGAPFFHDPDQAASAYYRLAYSSIPEPRIEPGIRQIAAAISASG